MLALAGLAGYLARWRKRRRSPLSLAQAAHDRWIARPDDAEASRNCYRCVARLVGWFDSLPVAQRNEACREEGLAVDTDPMEETDLCRFTVTDEVPARRFKRCDTRAGIGVPVGRMAAKRWFGPLGRTPPARGNCRAGHRNT